MFDNELLIENSVLQVRTLRYKIKLSIKIHFYYLHNSSTALTFI